MSINHSLNCQRKPRVLVLSLRKVKFHVCTSNIYEFEDLICDVDNVDLITPEFHPELFKFTNRGLNYLLKGINVSNLTNPFFKDIPINKKYDLFFFICRTPLDIISLNSIKGWRNNCEKAVCLLDEIWINEAEGWKNHLQLLKQFDRIFMTIPSSINAVANIIERSCDFLSFGVDAIKFCPYPTNPGRNVDVYSVGRRSVVTHKALIDMSKQKDFFYVYDTIKDLFVNNWKDHRNLYANFIKRSKFVIVNRAKFDAPIIGNQQQAGPRFFEAAAGGAVMLGIPPVCDIFNAHFNWPDAVLEIPFDAPNIAEIIANLNSQPERLMSIRTNSVVNSLLRHDWVYRWERILQIVGLESTPKMISRQARLQDLAEVIEKKYMQQHLSTTNANLASLVSPP